MRRFLRRWFQPLELPFDASMTEPPVDAKRAAKGKTILVAAFPKSGSTYLTAALKVVTGYPRGVLVQFYGQNEQDLCEDRIIRSLGRSQVVHQHVRATNNTLVLLEKYRIRPVVLVRNIFDVLFSIRDHLNTESHLGPGVFVHPEYFEMNENEQFAFLARMAVPWYLNFYVSWLKAESEVDLMWVTYEELFSQDPSQVIRRVLGHLDIDVPQGRLGERLLRLEGDNTRLNVGIAGRGAGLEGSLHDEIVAMAESWRLPAGSFQRIGISI